MGDQNMDLSAGIQMDLTFSCVGGTGYIWLVRASNIMQLSFAKFISSCIQPQNP